MESNREARRRRYEERKAQIGSGRIAKAMEVAQSRIYLQEARIAAVKASNGVRNTSGQIKCPKCDSPMAYLLCCNGRVDVECLSALCGLEGKRL